MGELYFTGATLVGSVREANVVIKLRLEAITAYPEPFMFTDYLKPPTVTKSGSTPVHLNWSYVRTPISQRWDFRSTESIRKPAFEFCFKCALVNSQSKRIFFGVVRLPIADTHTLSSLRAISRTNTKVGYKLSLVAVWLRLGGC